LLAFKVRVSAPTSHFAFLLLVFIPFAGTIILSFFVTLHAAELSLTGTSVAEIAARTLLLDGLL